MARVRRFSSIATRLPARLCRAGVAGLRRGRLGRYNSRRRRDRSLLRETRPLDWPLDRDAWRAKACCLFETALSIAALAGPLGRFAARTMGVARLERISQLESRGEPWSPRPSR